MARVEDLQNKTPDAAFDHAKSRQRFQVTHQDGKMQHRALLLTDVPQEVVLSEYPVKYVVGSGRHSFTCLIEDDGFLAESPVSWYESRKSWGMSPGYDREVHPGFERPIGENCLHCHAGQIELIVPVRTASTSRKQPSVANAVMGRRAACRASCGEKKRPARGDRFHHRQSRPFVTRPGRGDLSGLPSERRRSHPGPWPKD